MRKLFERLGLIRRPITAEDIHALWVARGGTITPRLREAYAAYKRNEEALKKRGLAGNDEKL